MQNYIFLVIVVLGLYYLGRYFYQGIHERKLGKKIAAIFKKIDESYEAFVEENMNAYVINHDNLDFDKSSLKKQCLQHLTPFIDELFYKMNDLNAKSLRTSYQSTYFSNVLSFVENKLRTESKMQSLNKMKALRNELEETFDHAIDADLTDRILQYQTRNV